jgi:hypothetical protein
VETSGLTSVPSLPGELTHCRPWSPLDWTSSDDRVRGGSSVSHLHCEPSSPIAVFNGNLDIKTLGGAGFASQRTTGEDRSWDLSKYNGLELEIKKSDGKQYTFLLKDSLLEKSPNGREQSTVSWEYDFKAEGAQSGNGKVFVAWKDLKPTYRGKEKKDAEPLDLKNIKRVSIMMRRYNASLLVVAPILTQPSFFGSQEGDFSLSIVSIAASTKPSSSLEPYRDDPNEKSVPMKDEKYAGNTPGAKESRGWLSWLCGSSA